MKTNFNFVATCFVMLNLLTFWVTQTLKKTSVQQTVKNAIKCYYFTKQTKIDKLLMKTQ
jgi:hypothetical protein